MKSWTRKDFIRASLSAGGAAWLGSGSGLAAPAIAASGSANGDIRVGIIGVRGQGGSHLRTYLHDIRGARVVALCDVDQAVLDRRVADAANAGFKVTPYRDCRKLLENPDIDAVVIATPNHWHSLLVIWALQAGKDVYVEKPLSHDMWEARQALEGARRHHKRIVQFGTQNRSSRDIPEAIAYIRSGALGKVQWVRGLCYKERRSIGKTVGPQPIPATIDYNLWTGPAALVPSRRNSPENGTVHYDWHWFWNYGGGDIANQGIHQMDVARWMLGESGPPPTVQSLGGRFGYDDDAETPNTQIAVFGYPTAPLIFEVRGLPMRKGLRAMGRYRGVRVGVVVQCEGGDVEVGEAGTASIFDPKGKLIRRLAAGGLETHRQNFVDAVHSRRHEDIRGQLENGYRSTTLCHMANISYRLGQDKANAEVAEAIRSNEPTREAFGRMLEHLKANGVDTDQGRAVIGPLLNFDSGTERFGGSDGTLAGAANADLIRRRPAGRPPFVVPELTRNLSVSPA